ncbi:MAG: hypothetical protein V4549_01315, partial [Bacteroidota bacterium]
ITALDGSSFAMILTSSCVNIFLSLVKYYFFLSNFVVVLAMFCYVKGSKCIVKKVIFANNISYKVMFLI